jgi:hypothetical protein
MTATISFERLSPAGLRRVPSTNRLLKRAVAQRVYLLQLFLHDYDLIKLHRGLN